MPICSESFRFASSRPKSWTHRRQRLGWQLCWPCSRGQLPKTRRSSWPACRCQRSCRAWSCSEKQKIGLENLWDYAEMIAWAMIRSIPTSFAQLGKARTWSFFLLGNKTDRKSIKNQFCRSLDLIFRQRKHVTTNYNTNTTVELPTVVVKVLATFYFGVYNRSL